MRRSGFIHLQRRLACADVIATPVLFFALLFGVVIAFGVGPAGAAPVGAITEFAGLNPGGNPAQVVAGPDGNLWFSDRSGAVGRITTGGAVTEFTAG